MAITPDELVQREREETEASIREMEEKIDKLLLENFHGLNMPLELPVGKLYRAKGDTAGLLDIVIDNYRKSGWNVEQRADRYVFTVK